MAQRVETEPNREFFRKQVQEFTNSLEPIKPQIIGGNPKERLVLMSHIWRAARKDVGVSRVQLSKLTGYREDDLRLFEEGEKDPLEISEDFIEDIAFTLKKPNLMAIHLTIFSPDESTTS